MKRQQEKETIRYLFVSICFLAFYFLICFGLVSGCKCKDKKEISSWDFGRGADKHCPVLGAYPIFLKSELSEEQNKTLGLALERWNKVAKKESPAFSFFAWYKERKFYPHPGGWMGTWPLVATVKGAPPALRGYGKLCEPLMRGLDPFIQGAAMGQVFFEPVGRPYQRATLQVCLEKLKKASKMVGDPVAQRVKEGGLYRILLHELGHILGGNGTGHPRTYGEVMRPRPANEAVSFHFATLLQERVVKPCMRANRWSKKIYRDDSSEKK